MRGAFTRLLWRIEARNLEALASLEARQRAAIRALESIAANPASLRAVEAVLAFLEDEPRSPPGQSGNETPSRPTTATDVGSPIQRNRGNYHWRGQASDSASRVMDAALEVRIEEILCDAGISYRKTKRAERIPGFDQAPDFIVPDEFNPRVVIEAKITEDGGTARDKVTRVQHLDELSRQGMPEGTFKFEVIACIGGRGFGIRREDMKKLLLATRGKVFTLKHLGQLVESSTLQQFRTM